MAGTGLGRRQQGMPRPDGAADGARDHRAADGLRRERIVRGDDDAAGGDDARPRVALEPGQIDRPAHVDVADHISLHGELARNTGDVGGDHGRFGEGASHTVGVQHLDPETRGPSDRRDSVASADLRRHDRGDPAPERSLRLGEKGLGLRCRREHLDADRRRTDPGHHDDRVVGGEVVDTDQLDGAVFDERALHDLLCRVHSAAATGSEDRRARCECWMSG